MKILQINKFLYPAGGSETYMFQLSKALQGLGHEVKFWGMHDEQNIVSDFPNLECDNINFRNQNSINKINSVFNTIYSKKNKKKIAKVLDLYKPDIVHIHNYNFQITPSILPEIKKRGIKIVQTIHDSQMVCPYHRLYNFQRDKVCTKCVKGSFFNCINDRCFDGSVLKSTVGAIESAFYHSSKYYDKYIDIYISPSNFLANLIQSRVHKKIIVIPNFTKTKAFTSNKKTTNEYYLYYGRISEEKGVQELIEIFKETKQNLLIVGKGPIDDIIKEKAKNSSNIKYIGAKFDEELFNIVKNAKYVVQPSKWFENCPMTIIESFSLGVPVIGSNHSGFKDLIQNEKTGYLVDFNQKSKTISKLLEIDLQNVSILKKNVSMYYDNNLSKEIHLSNILSVYNKILGRSVND